MIYTTILSIMLVAFANAQSAQIAAGKHLVLKTGVYENNSGCAIDPYVEFEEPLHTLLDGFAQEPNCLTQDGTIYYQFRQTITNDVADISPDSYFRCVYGKDSSCVVRDVADTCLESQTKIDQCLSNVQIDIRSGREIPSAVKHEVIRVEDTVFTEPLPAGETIFRRRVYDNPDCANMVPDFFEDVEMENILEFDVFDIGPSACAEAEHNLQLEANTDLPPGKLYVQVDENMECPQSGGACKARICLHYLPQCQEKAFKCILYPLNTCVSDGRYSQYISTEKPTVRAASTTSDAASASASMFIVTLAVIFALL